MQLLDAFIYKHTCTRNLVIMSVVNEFEVEDIIRTARDIRRLEDLLQAAKNDMKWMCSIPPSVLPKPTSLHHMLITKVLPSVAKDVTDDTLNQFLRFVKLSRDLRITIKDGP